MNIDQISGVQAVKFCRQAETRRFTEADQPSNVSSKMIILNLALTETWHGTKRLEIKEAGY